MLTRRTQKRTEVWNARGRLRFRWLGRIGMSIGAVASIVIVGSVGNPAAFGSTRKPTVTSIAAAPSTITVPGGSSTITASVSNANKLHILVGSCTTRSSGNASLHERVCQHSCLCSSESFEQQDRPLQGRSDREGQWGIKSEEGHHKGRLPRAGGTAPAITSSNTATFFTYQGNSFTVTATGVPTPTFSEVGPLPSGVGFDDATGVLSGTPTATGNFPITIAASNGVSPAATQSFTLIVDAAEQPRRSPQAMRKRSSQISRTHLPSLRPEFRRRLFPRWDRFLRAWASMTQPACSQAPPLRRQFPDHDRSVQRRESRGKPKLHADRGCH